MAPKTSELLSGYIKYFFLKVLEYSAMLPLKVRYRITDAISFFVFLFVLPKRNAVKKNLFLILGRKPSARDVLKVFMEYGKYWAELGDITNFWNSSSKVIYGPDFPPVEKCFLGLTFHLGNFEVFGNAFFPYTQSDIHVVAERLRPQFLADYFKGRRLQYHIKTVAHDNRRQILTVLKEGKSLGIVCDRVVGGTGVEARLFGKRIQMPLNIVDYALQKKIPVYIAYCINEKGTLKVFCRKIAENGGFEKVMKDVVSTLEDVIRRYPYQWHVLEAL